MPRTKRIVCLANSRKLSGRCIAGKAWSDNGPGEWIRPVSDRENEEVSEYERQYEDGGDPRVLDIIELRLLSPKPKDHQRENWLLDPKFTWVKTGILPRTRLDRLLDPVAPLWSDEHGASQGRDDRVSLETAKSPDSSLRLIHVDRLRLSVFKPDEAEAS